VKGSWTRQEDETILDYVAQFGTKNWAKLAEMLTGRIGKQCRERWRNHLDPDNNHAPWTPEEDQMLVELHEQYGNQWVKMASIMKGRSDNHIKNRWNSTLRKQNPIARAECATPQKRTRRKVDTPDSLSQMPRPNLDSVAISEPAPTFPVLSWTPVANQGDLISPLLMDKSPFGFGSPMLRPTQLSPWAGDFMRTPGRGALLFSPQIRGHDEIGGFFSGLDSSAKN
jgi:hypothetical protein